MKVGTIRAEWVASEGHRLDVGPYLSGGYALSSRIELLSNTSRLGQLTHGHNGGIYTPPIHNFSRNYVTSEQHGVPFIGSTSMLWAELSNVKRLAKKDAYSRKLLPLRLAHGMTLISCSGTIGRTAYVRPGMDGIWSSGDIMKVVPNPTKIRPGYLYAVLSSEIGVPRITSGTYGTIVKHIEAPHLADLAIPRLGDSIEEDIARDIEDAARKIDEYGRLLRDATAMALRCVGVSDASPERWHQDKSRFGWRQVAKTTRSLRALNFDPRAQQIDSSFRLGRFSYLGELCDPRCFKGKIIFKRVDADPEHGVLLVGQRTAFHLNPTGRTISRASVRSFELQVPAGTTLVPSHGTLGEQELYCRALVVTPGTARFAYSGDFFRCIPLDSDVPWGYLFAILRSESAFRLLRAISSGSKQQEQHPAMMAEFPIPRLAHEVELKIHELVRCATVAFDDAVALEQLARSKVGSAVRGDSKWRA